MIVSARKLPVFFEEKSDFLRQLRLSEPTFKLKCLITSWVPSSGFILDLRLLFVREFCCARYVGLQAEGNSLPFLITSVTRKLPVLFEVKSDCLRQLRLSEPTFKLKCLTTSWVPSSGCILDLRLLFVREFCCARYVGLQAFLSFASYIWTDEDLKCGTFLKDFHTLN